MGIITIILIGVGVLSILLAFAWYRIVPSSEAHLVIRGTGTKGVYSSDTKFRTNKAGSSYFAIPEFIPIVGRIVRKLDVTIKEENFEQETIEKDQARYMVTSSTKYRVTDVEKAAESFISESDLRAQLKEIIQAAVREITVKYDVINARSKRKEIGDEIHKSIVDDLANWGVELVNFVLVDFKDAKDSTVISDISLRREVEINSMTREENAEKVKQARIKEAESDEKAQEREIARDKVIGERKQQAFQAVAEKEKLAQEKVFEVKKVQTIKQATINKEAAIIKAEEDKETELILKEKKKLEGEGDRLKAEQQALGDAAKIREELFAEAEGKDKLQESLNKFTNMAIHALTAELQINANKEVGIAGARALEQADVRMFTGSDEGKGFDIGKAIAQTRVANDGTANAMLNNIARPNDLGLTALQLKEIKEKQSSKKKDSQVDELEEELEDLEDRE